MPNDAPADVPEVPTFDIPKRQTDSSFPKPHIDAKTYDTNYQASIRDTDGFWGKVSTLVPQKERAGKDARGRRRWDANRDRCDRETGVTSGEMRIV